MPRRLLRSILLSSVAAIAIAAGALAANAALPQQSGAVDLLSQANVQIDGALAGDRAGLDVAGAGDVNGDGLGDVIIGVPLADNNGRADSGSAYVVFGRTALGTIDLGSLGGGGFRIDGAVAGDSAGQKVAGAGDVNGDGRTDVVVASPSATVNARVKSGAVYVVFGKTSAGTVDLASLGSAGIRIDGAEASDSLGLAVAGGGDVNGDGKADLVVNGWSKGAFLGVSVYVVFGGGADPIVDLANLGPAGFRMDAPAVAGQISWPTVAITGDMNGDGRAEIVIANSVQHMAYVVFGRTSSTALPLAALGTAGFAVTGASPDSVATIGDMNGDGRADFALGAGGTSYVVFGKAATTAVDLAALGATGFTIAGAGEALAGPGDVNGDGRPDLVVGRSHATANGRTFSGLAYVVFGKASNTSLDLSSLGSSGFRIEGAAAGDAAAFAVAAPGDVNGDGRPDVLVASPEANNNGRAGSGSAYLVLGFGPAALSYDPVIGSVGKALVPQGPKAVARTGAAAFSVSPALPAGLVLDPRTGIITGTPNVAAPTGISVNVSMNDLTGTTTVPVTISVVQPDTKAPGVTLGAKPLQRVAKTGRFFVASSCDEGCILSAAVVFSVKGIRTTVSSIPAKRTLKTAKKTNFRIVFTPDARNQLKAILLPGRKGSAAITLTAVDASGNTTTKTLNVSVAP